MRKMPAVIIVIVLIAAAGYTLYWHQKADDFKQMLEQSIATLNEQMKPVTKGAPLIRYEALDATGFPFGMTIEVRKPVVDLPMAALLRAFPPPGIPAAAIAATDWVEEVSYGENVAFSGNISGNHFTLSASGDRTHKTLIDGKESRRLIGSSSGPLVCHLNVEQDGGAPWTMRPVFSDLQTFVAIFRAGNCAVEGVALKDAANGTLLFSADAISAGMSNDAAGKTDRKIALTSEYKNAKATPAFDVIVNDYAQRANMALYQATQAPPMIPVSVYGTMNAKVDLRYEGPTDSTAMADPQAKMRFDVNAFDISDALADSTLEAHIATEPEGSDRIASVNVKSRGEVSELFDRLMPQQLTAVLRQMEQNGRTPEERQLGEYLARLGKPEEVVAAALPKLHPLGKTALDIEASVKGPNDKPNTFLLKGIYKLDALNWVAGPYGITQSGNANLSLQGKPASGEWTIHCLNCDALVTDLGNYALRVESLAGRLQQPPKPPSFGADLFVGVKRFLHGINEAGADSDAKNITIHIVMKSTGELLVSGKQVLEVASLFATTIAPYMHAPAPAPIPPAPPTSIPR